jgi:GINS complex protein
VQGDYGPFKASFPVDVPLWMAIYLHQRKQCRIHLPDWLNAEHLQGATFAGQQTGVHRASRTTCGSSLICCSWQAGQWLKLPYCIVFEFSLLSALPADVFEAEKQTSSVFQELPWHYLEVAHVLLTSAKECFSSVKEHMEVLQCLMHTKK